MKTFISNPVPARAQAQVRIGLVIAISFLAAFGLAFQYYRHVQAQQAAAQKAAAENAKTLLPSTEAVLNSLKSPIELRFYSLLDPASTPESTRAFADRVNQLLAQYERDGKGNIHVVRFDEMTDANAK